MPCTAIVLSSNAIIKHLLSANNIGSWYKCDKKPLLHNGTLRKPMGSVATATAIAWLVKQYQYEQNVEPRVVTIRPAVLDLQVLKVRVTSY